MVGERILAAAESMRPVARIVRAAHERYDGSGFPDGLAGDEIPLAARIIAACTGAHDPLISEAVLRFASCSRACAICFFPFGVCAYAIAEAASLRPWRERANFISVFIRGMAHSMPERSSITHKGQP